MSHRKYKHFSSSQLLTILVAVLEALTWKTMEIVEIKNHAKHHNWNSKAVNRLKNSFRLPETMVSGSL